MNCADLALLVACCCYRDPQPLAASSGPPVASMFDDEEEVVDEEEAAVSDDDAFVVAKPQVRVVASRCNIDVAMQNLSVVRCWCALVLRNQTARVMSCALTYQTGRRQEFRQISR